LVPDALLNAEAHPAYSKTMVIDDAFAARLKSENASLQAFVSIAPDADFSARREGPLAGFSVGVKDLIDTRDFPTSYGSPIYRDHRPAADAAVVEALKAAGAFVAGKTTTTEFATWPPTPTLNPRNRAHTPGGSSAGSAAAVAAGLVDIALGTQTKGSVIRPASFCGVVGFKPSFNRLSRAGVKMLSESLDTVGLFANSVADAEHVYKVLTRDADPASPAASLRIAFSRTPQWSEVASDAQAAILGGIDFLRGEDIAIDEITMPDGFERLPAETSVVHDYEMSRALFPEFRNARGKIEPSLAAAIEAALGIPGDAYAEALLFLTRMRAIMDGLFSRYDVVLCAAAPGEAPPLSERSTGSPIMNLSWTALHLPCITLPVLTGQRGLPIGLQLVGGPYRDRTLLAAAAVLERAFVKGGA
jgi:Asp-tRNA(Asn)/Glu-tRNA(Gln) amidotransferase A subunit family amidase